MSSSPSVLKSSGLLELAVKYSSWAPANWVHTQCAVGDCVTLRSTSWQTLNINSSYSTLFRFGGDFYYPLDDLKETHSLLLIGGGVGINPLRSIFQHSAELVTAAARPAPSQVSLLYSAATAEELIFRQQIEERCRLTPGFQAEFFVTREMGEDGEVKCRRITKADIERTVRGRQRTERLICYLCGPPDMVDQLRVWLLQLNVSEENIRYELWW